MKYCLLSILLLPFVLQAQTGSSEDGFVCTPCGYACDSARYDSPGSCPTCTMSLVESSTVHFENINFEEMCNRIKRNKNLLLIDVRSHGEFTGENKEVNSYGHFKNAININVSDLESRLSELEPYKNKEIIIYCSHSHRSPRATYIMTNNGFKNVTNVTGGVSILTTQYGDISCLSDIFISH